MHINWYGQGHVVLKGKDLEVVINPFSAKNSGLKAPKVKEDQVVLLSEFGTGKDFGLEGNKMIDCPGEYEFSGVFIYGTGVEEYPKIIYSINLDGMTVGHLGAISEIPADEVINQFSEVDILFVPVGGKSVLTASKAAKLISQIEPKIVIPIYHQLPGDKMEFESVDKFVKEIGLNPQEEGDKVILKKSDVGEEMQLILLKP